VHYINQFLNNRIRGTTMNKYKMFFEASPNKKYKGQFKEDDDDNGFGREFVFEEQISKMIEKYFIKNKIPASRAKEATSVMMMVANGLIEDSCSKSSLNAITRFVDKFLY